MVFSSLNFIFIFLPLFLFAYYVTPAAFRNSTLFAGSILFYAVGVIKQPYALFLLMVLTYLDRIMCSESAFIRYTIQEKRDSF